MKNSVSTVDQIQQAIDMLVEGCDFYKKINTDKVDASVSELMQVISTEKQRAIDALTELTHSLTEDNSPDSSPQSKEKNTSTFPGKCGFTQETVERLLHAESNTLAILDSALEHAPNAQIIRGIRQVRIRLQQCQDALSQFPNQ